MLKWAENHTDHNGTNVIGHSNIFYHYFEAQLRQKIVLNLYFHGFWWQTMLDLRHILPNYLLCSACSYITRLNVVGIITNYDEIWRIILWNSTSSGMSVAQFATPTGTLKDILNIFIFRPLNFKLSYDGDHCQKCDKGRVTPARIKRHQAAKH